MIEGYYIYVYYDPTTDVPFYVGKGKAYRAHKHLHQTHSREMRMKIQSIRSSGLEPKISIVPTPSEPAAFEVEALLIKCYGRRVDKSGTLFNIAEGGEATRGFEGRTHTAEARAKISAAHKGRKFSDETIERMREAGKRRDVSHLHSADSVQKRIAAQGAPEARARNSETAKRTFCPIRHAEMTERARIANTGCTRSEEHRRKISVAVKSRVISKESRLKMSLAQKRRYAK